MLFPLYKAEREDKNTRTLEAADMESSVDRGAPFTEVCHESESRE